MTTVPFHGIILYQWIAGSNREQLDEVLGGGGIDKIYLEFLYSYVWVHDFIS